MQLDDCRDRLVHRAGVADDLEVAPELGPDAGSEQLVVVDDEDPDRHGALLGSLSTTSVPAPGRLCTVARPAVALHAANDRVRDAAPVGRDGVGIEAGALVADEGGDRVLLDLDVDADGGAARMDGRVGHRLRACVDEAPQPFVHLRVTDDDGLDADLVLSLDPAGHRVDRVAQPDARSSGARPYSQARSSRSWVRARLAISRGAFARWMSASVWRTESWRCAAISARSSDRTRLLRSSTSWRPMPQIHGPASSAAPPRATIIASSTLPRPSTDVLAARKTAIPPG